MSYEETIRGTEFKYSSFLWENVRAIRRAEMEAKYASALDLAISLIPYLPNGIKKKFDGRAKKIEKDMQYLASEVKKKAFDMFQEGVVRNRVLNKYAKVKLGEFVDELCGELDKRGYMEKKQKVVPRGRE